MTHKDIHKNHEMISKDGKWEKIKYNFPASKAVSDYLQMFERAHELNQEYFKNKMIESFLK